MIGTDFTLIPGLKGQRARMFTQSRHEEYSVWGEATEILIFSWKTDTEFLHPAKRDCGWMPKPHSHLFRDASVSCCYEQRNAYLQIKFVQARCRAESICACLHYISSTCRVCDCLITIINNLPVKNKWVAVFFIFYFFY